MVDRGLGKTVRGGGGLKEELAVAWNMWENRKVANNGELEQEHAMVYSTLA